MQERFLQMMGEWLKINGEAITEPPAGKSIASGARATAITKTAAAICLLKITIDPDPGYAVKEVFYTYNATAPTSTRFCQSIPMQERSC